jgi:hypothetical protein
MRQFDIVVTTFRQVQDFVSLAMVQPFEVLVGSDKHMFDAKSFIGMVNLDFSHPIKVLCDCDSEIFQSFRQKVSKFLA